MIKDKMTWILNSYNFLAICCKCLLVRNSLTLIRLMNVITIDDGCMMVVMVVGIHGGCLILIEMKMQRWILLVISGHGTWLRWWRQPWPGCEQWWVACECEILSSNVLNRFYFHHVDDDYLISFLFLFNFWIFFIIINNFIKK